MVSGSCEVSASIPPCGMLNGLWLKSICPVSSFSSYIGKSVIQQKSNRPGAIRPRSWPSLVRTAPANFGASSRLPAAKNTASPACSPHASADRLGPLGLQVARDRPLRPVGLEHDVAEAAGPLLARPLVQLVEKAARVGGRPRRRNRPHHPAGGGDLREQPEPGPGELRRHVGDPQRVAQVRLVAADRPASPRHRECAGSGGLVTARPSANSSNTPAITGSMVAEHVLLGDVAHLEVELVELAGRTVGAARLVAEAGRNLEVAVETRHHDAAA